MKEILRMEIAMDRALINGMTGQHMRASGSKTTSKAKASINGPMETFMMVSLSTIYSTEAV